MTANPSGFQSRRPGSVKAEWRSSLRSPKQLAVHLCGYIEAAKFTAARADRPTEHHLAGMFVEEVRVCGE